MHVHRISDQAIQLHPSTSQKAGAEAVTNQKHRSRRELGLGSRTAWPNLCLKDGFARVKMAHISLTHKQVQIIHLGLVREGASVSSRFKLSSRICVYHYIR
jgi:hypothetical protein